MTWNLLNGGQDSGSHDRLDLITQVVREQSPDIALFQEATNFDAQDSRMLHGLEKNLGMCGFLAVAGTGYHLAAYVRDGGRVRHFDGQTQGFFHALIDLSVSLDDGSRLRLLGVHFCPDSPEVRSTEAAHLVKLIRNGEHTLVAGDFNSLDPHGVHHESLKQMPDYYRARYVISDDGKPDTRATRTLENVGLVDLAVRYESSGFTIPTKLPVYGADFGRLRLDYVYATEPLASTVTGIRVLRTDRTDRASDHYPLVVDLDIARLPASELPGVS